MVRDIFLTHNAMLEKDDFAYNMVYDLLGDAFVQAKSNETWKLKRKICAHAFYKDKIEGMTEVMRNIVLDKVFQYKKIA